MTDPRVRRLSDHPERLEELARLHFQEWGHLRPDERLETRTERLRKAAGRDGIPSVFVALERGELCGSAMLVSCDMDMRPELTSWVGGLFVKPHLRNRGIGGMLTRHVMTEAKTLGFQDIYLYTETAQGFYEGLGWHVVERVEYLGVSVAVMTHSLKDSA